MKQTLKNQYYSFIRKSDYETLSMIQTIFEKIDTLLLIEKGKNCKEELLSIISALAFTEETLYQQMKSDIENGILR